MNYLVAWIVIAICSFSSISGMAIASNLSSLPAYLPDISLIKLSKETNMVEEKIKQLIERQAKAWEAADSDTLVADFAEDSLFVVPGSTFRGKQQIKELAQSYFAKFTDTQVTIKRIIDNGNEGAIEWSWSDKNKKTGETSEAEDAIIFEIEEGKIKYWREYIDKQPQAN